MTAGLPWLLAALREFPDLLPVPPSLASWTNPERRLRDALIGAATEDEVLPTNPRDIVPLLRHVALAAAGGVPIPVARHHLLPDLDQWRKGGCDCTVVGRGYEVTFREWAPAWLPGAEFAPPARPTYAGHHEGLPPVNDTGPRADPFYEHATGRTHYRTPGQRVALHALLAARPGSTIVANLPTRSGKSALTFVPALLGAARGRIAVVVVPTTALAVDQERQFHDLRSPLAVDAPRVLAFHGGLTPAGKDELKRRIRDGTQAIVFTSPEGLMGTLRLAVSDAAAAGRLGLLAIDEAHTVSQWGDDFRPEFQALGGFRRTLLGASPNPFTTLLMTGTLTANTLDALVLLFKSAVGTHVMSSVDLRAEPTYWHTECSADERQDRVLEAVHQLPRPMLLYTTRVADADGWAQRLRLAGYGRIASVTGRTGSEDRRQVIEAVRGTARDARDNPRTGVDVVIATSAYGLGVDQPDVRAVVHACIPESIDRFYQEVGRGGRDGAPSLSLMLHTAADARTSEKLALTTVIGREKAQRRWEAMWQRRIGFEEDRHLVRTDVIPPHLDANNDYNEQWNLLTLLLMQRAAMVDLELPPVPEASPEEAPAAWEKLWVEHVVRLRTWDLSNNDRWRDLEREAAATHRRDLRSLDLMKEALKQQRSMADLLLDAYTINPGDSLTKPDLKVTVGRSHAGCPVTRRAGIPPRRDSAPTPRALADADQAVAPKLAELLDGNGFLAVRFDYALLGRRQRLRRSIDQAVDALARHGVRVMVASDAAVGREAIENSWTQAPSRAIFVAAEFVPRLLPGSPSLLLATRATPARELRAFRAASAPRVLLMPSDLPDPDRPDRKMAATSQAMRLHDFLRKVA